jgi:hypothetical protein
LKPVSTKSRLLVVYKLVKKNQKNMEEFKDIPLCDGMYQINKIGIVKSVGNDKSRKEKILKPGTKKSGYKYVILHMIINIK